ncbi:MAG TPA: four helix bundle suffix domain-containing protein [Kiritimatiellia bacterium]|nr:four helix bundle suffix domain-containing protein [Kiritimatiellia bacterium]
MADSGENGTRGTRGTDRARRSPRGSRDEPEEGFIPPHGGYANLHGYRKTEVIYRATKVFCDRFISRRSRTHDQMVQAARSGNKNIAEASQVSGTSKESEIKLTSVARGSLEELLGDYEDFLIHQDLTPWDKNSKEALYVRKLSARDDLKYDHFREFIETRPGETVANILICLINQANYLIDRQLRRLEQDFLKEGGLRERMTRARLQARAKQSRRSPP